MSEPDTDRVQIHAEAIRAECRGLLDPARPLPPRPIIANAIEKHLRALLVEHEALETEVKELRSHQVADWKRRAQTEEVLDDALGTEEEDGAGAGLVADVALLAERMKAAEAEVERYKALHESVRATADAALERDRDAWQLRAQDAEDRARTLAERSAKVRVLHRPPHSGAGWCAGCLDGGRADEYPCATIATLDGRTDPEPFLEVSP